MCSDEVILEKSGLLMQLRSLIRKEDMQGGNIHVTERQGIR
jgi:hypothetical protein